MVLPLFIKGFLIGIAVTAPAGPVTILCLRRSLTERPTIGVTMALAAATADALFGIIAVLGVSAISSFLLSHLTALRIIAGLFLLYAGYITFQKEPSLTPPQARTEDIIHAYFSTLVLTLSNPTSIIAFAALFTAFGLNIHFENSLKPLVLIAGIFSGTALWLSLLSMLIHFFKSYLTLSTIQKMNKTAGMLLIIFGCAALISILTF